jgi:hypothetical protein
MFYCGKACQLADWRRGHKFGECKAYAYEKELAGVEWKLNQGKDRKWIRDYDTACLLLRLYLLAEHKPTRMTKRSECPPFVRRRSFDDLMGHQDAVRRHGQRMEIFEQLLVMYERARVPVRRDQLFEVFCRMYVNGFSIMTSQLTEIGRAVYVLASMYDHSCVPNAVTVFNGINIQVRTMRRVDITKEPILISYLNVLVPPKQRITTLTDHYYFTCKCERCLYEQFTVGTQQYERVQPTKEATSESTESSANAAETGKTVDKKVDAKCPAVDGKKVNESEEKEIKKDDSKSAQVEKKDGETTEAEGVEEWHELKKHKNRKVKKCNKAQLGEEPEKGEKEHSSTGSDSSVVQLQWDPSPSESKKKEFAAIMQRLSENDRMMLDKHKQLNSKMSDLVLNRKWPEAFKVSCCLLKNFEIYYANMPNPEITMHLVQMLQIERNALRHEFTLNNQVVRQLWERLTKDISITHGTDHELYVEFYTDLANYLV